MSQARCNCINIPGIVNGVFAIELYFKSLIRSKGKNKGHELLPLFKKLPKEISEEIELLAKPRMESLKAYEMDFIGHLEDISNAFVKWRYIHEEKQTDGFMGTKINMYLSFLAIALPIIEEVADKYRV